MIIGVALLSICRVEEAVAGEIRIDPSFQAGSKIVFEQSMAYQANSKMKMLGSSERSKETTDLVATLSMNVASDGANRQTVTATIDRIRGGMSGVLGGGKIKIDTVGVEGSTDWQELAKITNEKKRMSVMMSEMMHGKTGDEIKMVIENDKLVKADAGANSEKLLFGPYMCDEAWIRLTTEFMHSGFPSGPVKQGARWSREVVYPVPGSMGQPGTPLEFNFTLDELRPQGGGRGTLAKISYQAKLDSPIRIESDAMMKRVSNVKSLTVTGVMHYDTKKRMFTQHDQSVSSAADVTVPGLEAKGTVTTQTTLGLKLLSFEPGAEAPGNSAGVTQADLIPERVWTDLKGRKLTATLVSLDSEVGKFRRNNGKTFDYPVRKLSTADRKLIAESNRAHGATAKAARERPN